MTGTAPATATQTENATASDTILSAPPFPALRLLGSSGAVCVDGTCSIEPAAGVDPQ
jgi:hypothetical protein